MVADTGASVSFKRVPALDGVRGIAILLVLGVHAGFVPGGRIGVDLFFVLSGFLISSLLLREYRSRGSIHIGLFYLRRALRLLPALVPLIIAVLIYAKIYGTPQVFAMTLVNAREVALYYFNWRLVYDLPHHQHMFSHLWSLSVEEQFYIVWPLLTLILLKSGLSRRMSFLLIGAGIAGPAIARLIFWPHDWYKALWIYFQTFLRFDDLMWGVLLAWLVDAGIPAPIERHLRWAGPLALAGLALVSARELLMRSFFYLGGFSAVGLTSMVLVAGARDPAPWFRRVLSFGPLCWVGRVSYGVYLWHWTVMVFFMERGIANNWSRVPAELVVIFAIAIVSFYCWERPFLRLKDRYGHV